MRSVDAKKRLKLALVLCAVVGAGGWLYARRSSSAARPAAAPPAAADPAAAIVEAHRAAGEAKDWPRQAALWAEVVAGGDPARRRLIQDDRARWLLRALKENDDASASSLAAAMIADTGNDEINPRHALKEWRSRWFEKWRAARAAKDAPAAAAALAAMSAWEPLDSDLPRDIVASAEPAELLTMGQNALRDGAPASAALLLRAVLMARGDRIRAEASARLDDAIMLLAADPARSQPRPDGPPPSVDLYERVSGPRRTEALTVAAGLIEARADALLADKPELCGPLYDEAQRRLSEAASREREPLPDAVVSRLSGKSLDARLAATLKRLDTDLEGAFAELRPLMRDDKDEARSQRALEAMVDSWRKARDAKSFDRLLDLSAFLVSEVGTPPADDPFSAEFKKGLAALAEDSKKESLDKQVLALSLLADAFPGDPEGRDARRESVARGAELARAAAVRGEPPEPVGLSGLAGRSVALIENDTARHVLMTFVGPESFLVRVDPYRRGSIVFKDGKYLVGAASVKGELAAYSAEAAFGEVLVRRRFAAPARGPAGPARGQFGFISHGNWTILRAPDGEAFTANPMNGTVRP